MSLFPHLYNSKIFFAFCLETLESMYFEKKEIILV